MYTLRHQFVVAEKRRLRIYTYVLASSPYVRCGRAGRVVELSRCCCRLHHYSRMKLGPVRAKLQTVTEEVVT